MLADSDGELLEASGRPAPPDLPSAERARSEGGSLEAASESSSSPLADDWLRQMDILDAEREQVLAAKKLQASSRGTSACLNRSSGP